MHSKKNGGKPDHACRNSQGDGPEYHHQAAGQALLKEGSINKAENEIRQKVPYTTATIGDEQVCSR
ncbi:hypothetical protein JCM39068_26450 [Desulfocastanea catecholica]